MLRSATFASAILSLFFISNSALACNAGSLQININWLRGNNAGSYSGIVSGCRALEGSMESGTALTNIVNAYKGGQSHNPSAQADIDGCTAVQLANICSSIK
jgi:hypothetical protein